MPSVRANLGCLRAVQSCEACGGLGGLHWSQTFTTTIAIDLCWHCHLVTRTGNPFSHSDMKGACWVELPAHAAIPVCHGTCLHFLRFLWGPWRSGPVCGLLFLSSALTPRSLQRVGLCLSLGSWWGTIPGVWESGRRCVLHFPFQVSVPSVLPWQHPSNYPEDSGSWDLSV